MKAAVKANSDQTAQIVTAARNAAKTAMKKSAENERTLDDKCTSYSRPSTELAKSINAAIKPGNESTPDVEAFALQLIATFGKHTNSHKFERWVKANNYQSTVNPSEWGYEEWTEFAKKGTPNSINNPTWKEFGIEENYLILDQTLENSNKLENEFCEIMIDEMIERASS